jgi:ParB family transcriptional regulator, chromosome partitioning protein
MTVANTRETWFRQPITATRQKEPDKDGKHFDIVCGYGRLEAFVALGAKTIPAVIIETSHGKRSSDWQKGSSREGTTH